MHWEDPVAEGPRSLAQVPMGTGSLNSAPLQFQGTGLSHLGPVFRSPHKALFPPFILQLLKSHRATGSLKACHSPSRYHTGRNNHHFTVHHLLQQSPQLPDLFSLPAPEYLCPRFIPELEEMTQKMRLPGSIYNLISPFLASGVKMGKILSGRPEKLALLP